MVSKEFKEILADFLFENRLSQSAFAEKINVKQSQVSEWLSDKAKPGYDILKRIAVAFDISADYLLGIKDYF
jgi:transcriptional regulator with XRE-family HTH domain